MTIKPALVAIFFFALLRPAVAWTQVAPGSMPPHWNEGAADCTANHQPRIEVHRYNDSTFILRENLCLTFEAPFLYLLVGSRRAVLIDTGDVEDPTKMPLASTVMALVPGDGPTKFPLLVVHTHRHLDHRAGDPQFANLPRVQVVPAFLPDVEKYFNFSDWPNGIAQLELGERTIDVVPAPGHNPTEVVLYDRNTGLLFSGDFLMPGRLLIDDVKADLASAERVGDFIRNRPVSHVLGGHIEFNTAGVPYSWESTYHPGEHVLQLSKDDLLALPAALSHFNGFYTTQSGFVLMNWNHCLLAFGAACLIGLLALGVACLRFVRRRRVFRVNPWAR